jgi:hypothetical protein
MGQAKRRKAAFLAAHPKCCFCGGLHPSEEPDHVPPKAAFHSRVWPEDFEFPSCAACNRRTRLTDQYFSWHVRMFGWSDNERDSDERNTKNLQEGIANNQPHLLPRIPDYFDEARFRQSHGILTDEVRGVLVPRAAIDNLEKMYRKMAIAFCYRHTNKIVPPEAAVWAHVDWSVRFAPIERVIEVMKVPTKVARPMRRRKDFLGQFIYTWDTDAAGTMFAFAAKFSSAILGLAGCFLRPSDLTKEEKSEMNLFDIKGDQFG